MTDVPAIIRRCCERQPAARAPDEVRIYGHSPIVFWWPGLGGGVCDGGWRPSSAGVPVNVVPGLFGVGSSAVGAARILLGAARVLLVLFTNVKMRGIYSLTFVIATMFIVVLFAYLDWWDRIFEVIPYFTVHINLGFYLFFGTVLFFLWASIFFIFDRLTYWRIRPGQIIESRLIGGGQRTFDTEGLQFEQRPSDLFQQTILGAGAGDLVLRTGGVAKAEILIPNVLFAAEKIRRAQRLLAVKPDAPSQVA